MDQNSALVVFQDKQIRRIWHQEEWYFSVVDIIGVLTESQDPRNYWKVLKHRLIEEGSQVVTDCNQLKLPASDGKYYDTDCANTATLFRIIQSIPSPKAEPFKQWLAKVGYERVQEIEDPERAQLRMTSLYRAKGYSEAWIEKRIRGIEVRDELTGEWRKRGVEEGKEFAILTAEISKASFDLTPNEYKKLKGLNKENLRDHMTGMELIFNMLGEASASEIEKAVDPKTFPEHQVVSREGGTIAKNARLELESKTKKKIVTNENYLEVPESVKRINQ